MTDENIMNRKTEQEIKNANDVLYPQDSAAEHFCCTWNHMASLIHGNAIAKGFVDDGHKRNFGQLIALVHSELSESYEAFRDGNTFDDKLPTRLGMEVELADAVIRIMDMAEEWGLDVASSLVDKVRYNRSRPQKHGKTC